MVATSLVVSLCLSCLLLVDSILLVVSLSGGLVICYYYWQKQPPVAINTEEFEKYYKEMLTLLRASVALLSVIPLLVLKFTFLLLSLVICIKRYSTERIRSRYSRGERETLVNTPTSIYSSY
eukprot:TRINITY_DN12952_c0_g1_i1.p1 TRINITY_DN12952_c0_g1~~TRINITY_DN12952_c0_g1_i1.p1  ORF type:complete len:122 (-),score=12.75 TRINITY_DN12952_c0_g1_i1:265-630(-)